MTVLRSRADLFGKQVSYCSNTANRFSTITNIAVRMGSCRCMFVLLFGRYSLQLDNKCGYISPPANEKPVSINI